jgi:hypothetical protein
MSSIKTFIVAIFIFGCISINDSCSPPKKPTTTPKPEPEPVTFKFEFDFGNDVILKYNNVSDGKIRAQIQTKAEFTIITLTVVNIEQVGEAQVLGVLVPQIGNVIPTVTNGFEYLSSKKDGDNRSIDFNFVVCKSGSKVNFGADFKFTASALAQGVVPPTLEQKDIDVLADFIKNAKCD